MPIWLRKFTYQKLVEEYDKRNSENQKQYTQRKQSTTPEWVKDIAQAKASGKVPNYTVKKS